MVNILFNVSETGLSTDAIVISADARGLNWLLVTMFITTSYVPNKNWNPKRKVIYAAIRLIIWYP